MTNYHQYLMAGYDAFHMAFSTGHYGADHRPQRIDNPYSQRPYSDLWIRGWRAAQQLHEQGVPFSHNPFVNDRRIIDFMRYIAMKDKSKQRKQEARSKGKHFATKQETRADRIQPKRFVPKGPVLNLKRLEGFHRKNRTVV